jgi:hypothetical protein
VIIEKRTLPIGIEYDGKVHRDLEIRPRLVADMIDALESERSQRNNRYYALAMIACQIQKLGDIPKEAITADFLLRMYEQDFVVLTEAAEMAQKRVEGFCPGSGAEEKPTQDADGAPQGPAQGDTGNTKTGV